MYRNSHTLFIFQKLHHVKTYISECIEPVEANRALISPEGCQIYDASSNGNHHTSSAYERQSRVTYEQLSKNSTIEDKTSTQLILIHNIPACVPSGSLQFTTEPDDSMQIQVHQTGACFAIDPDVGQSSFTSNVTVTTVGDVMTGQRTVELDQNIVQWIVYYLGLLIVAFVSRLLSRFRSNQK